MSRIGLAAAAAAVALAGPAMAETFDLVCQGSAETTRDSVSSSLRDFGNMLAGKNAGSAPEANQQFRLMIEGDHGRLQSPSPIYGSGPRTGGTGAWATLSSVWLTPSTIEARYTLNQLNSARLVVDRRTGRTDIDGGVSFNFHGFCTPTPANAPPAP